MGIQSVITITHDKEVTNDVTGHLIGDVGDPTRETQKLINWISSMGAGLRNGTIDVQVAGGTAVAATGTLTLVSTVATNTCVINGVTFTAIASGATGNQFNVGGSDTITAANLAATINASVTALIPGYVTATSALGVVTVSSAFLGTAGNQVTLTGGSNITASAARLTGGAAAAANTYHYGI